MSGIPVMLACSAPAHPDTITKLTGTHAFELKIDGVRGILAISPTNITITNRNGVDITARYPDIVQAARKKFPDQTLVLDGEITVLVGGKPSFKATAKRDRQQKPSIIRALLNTHPAIFIAFDILWYDKKSLVKEDYVNRNVELRRLLGTTLSGRLSGGREAIIRNPVHTDGHKLLDFVRKHQCEGIVAKRLHSTYRSGRQADWIKIKPVHTVSCLVTSSSPGNGSRASTFGALSLAVYENQNLVPIGDVGSGFTQKDLVEITAILTTGQPLIIEVEYQELTVDGKLRFPVFKGIRTDISLEDCTLSFPKKDA